MVEKICRKINQYQELNSVRVETYGEDTEITPSVGSQAIPQSTAKLQHGETPMLGI